MLSTVWVHLGSGAGENPACFEEINTVFKQLTAASKHFNYNGTTHTFFNLIYLNQWMQDPCGNRWRMKKSVRQILALS